MKRKTRSTTENRINKKQSLDDKDHDNSLNIKDFFHPGKEILALSQRIEEQDKIINFIQNCVDTKNGGTIYVCGRPGTGKSASLNSMMKRIENNELFPKLKFHFYNGLDQSSQQNIKSMIIKRLFNQKSQLLNNNGNIDSVLDEFFQKNKSPLLLIIDEIDQLPIPFINKLYKYTIECKLILLGCSNDMNLINLVEKFNKQPFLLEFVPYNYDQILDILSSRCDLITQSYHIKDIFEKKALEYCSQKVNNTSGDVRIALDLCRKCLDREKDLPIKLPTMIKICGSAFNNVNFNIIESLPQMSKIILIILNYKIDLSSDKIVDSNNAYIIFRNILLKNNNNITDSNSIFNNAITTLSEYGLISTKNGKTTRGRNKGNSKATQTNLVISSNITMDDINIVTSGDAFLTNVVLDMKEM